ncbi:MAG TPA: translation initiation factor IF-3 [Candidatus Saccharimonadales bacterium]|nr:translation initiation factor IF-3 [Candidatus Saccharimonadales bacterium]
MRIKPLKEYSIRENYKVNHRIKFPELRVITRDGENLGVITTQEALRIAEERGQDLVVIAEAANPPVAKILDFNKYLYEEHKKESASRAKSKKSELKEFRFGPTIDKGDLETRISRAVGFLKDGNRVKISVKLQGRENDYPQIAHEKLDKFTEGIAEVGKPEDAPKRNGNIISITYVAK